MGKFHDLGDTVRLIGRKMDRLERPSKATFRLKLAGSCQSPVIVERQARPRMAYAGSFPEVCDKGYGAHVVRDPLFVRQPGHVIFLDMEVPCRVCSNCLRSRAAHWRHRAIAEIAVAPRTWMLTLTLNDQEQWEALGRAALLASKSSRNFSSLDDAAKKRLLIRSISPELTRYWKRVRKNSDAPLKFMWVAEFDSSGVRGAWNMHVHALVHERFPEKPVRKAVLKDAWRLGFSLVKLADEKAAFYVCKYITKTPGAGIRASHGYGHVFEEKRKKLTLIKKEKRTFLRSLNEELDGDG